MSKSRRISPFLATVKTAQWCKRFLNEIESIDGFSRFVRGSRMGEGFCPPEVDREKLLEDARLVVTSRDIDELTVARQYYNNAHLLAFWNILRGDLEQGYTSGRISREFPLFRVSRDVRSGGIALDGVAVEFLDNVRFDLDETTLLDSGDEQNTGNHTPVLFRLSDSDPRRQRPLNNAFMRLSLVTNILNESLESYYNYFIEYQFQLKSPVCDYYKIHYFLDNFLYVGKGGNVRRANYDAVFGNSNLYELKLYLQYCLDNNIALRPKDVTAFLERQRKFYLALALDISLEENEIHNRHKDLLVYDADRGVVRAKNIDAELIEHYRKTVIEALGVVKQNGCPFAMSMGASGNALIEVFQYFDEIMLRVLRHSLDFKRVFG